MGADLKISEFACEVRQRAPAADPCLPALICQSTALIQKYNLHCTPLQIHMHTRTGTAPDVRHIIRSRIDEALDSEPLHLQARVVVPHCGQQ